ncbi:hypothetical protein [Leptospira andrefontaineae]|uniref:Uncharacterized protein n=1 Tax=Leptospira andrefontaineae TaxID=2484976 RepID=A0A4R9H6Q0_9LEPT|nr:hypothetical protein [Leptospira andrefontaineae]TGK41281.1 hypothetical protein EHO65_07595 [Leptospira andrefontaineae]
MDAEISFIQSKIISQIEVGFLLSYVSQVNFSKNSPNRIGVSFFNIKTNIRGAQITYNQKKECYEIRTISTSSEGFLKIDRLENVALNQLNALFAEWTGYKIVPSYK